MGIGKQVLK